MDDQKTKLPDDRTTVDDLVSPANTEKLYGKEADEDEERPGQAETIETELPDAPDDVDENMFPSAD
ncbi:MAG: hypothetical protein JWN89_650 [Parcubacteria group bacterium]|nr:hypothetical protein [Parcubacteria group bacterium]